MIQIRQTLIRATLERVVLTIAFNSTGSLSPWDPREKKGIFHSILVGQILQSFRYRASVHFASQSQDRPWAKGSQPPQTPKQKPFHLNHLS